MYVAHGKLQLAMSMAKVKEINNLSLMVSHYVQFSNPTFQLVDCSVYTRICYIEMCNSLMMVGLAENSGELAEERKR